MRNKKYCDIHSLRTRVLALGLMMGLSLSAMPALAQSEAGESVVWVTLEVDALPTLEPSFTPGGDSTLGPAEEATATPIAEASETPVEPETTETPAPENPPEETAAPAYGVEFSVGWELPEDLDTLRIGDTVAQRIESEQDLGSAYWEIAEKSAEDLLEGEAEWQHAQAASVGAYRFALTREMQVWRWRVCVVTPEGEAYYSEELYLPEIPALQEEGPDEGTETDAPDETPEIPASEAPTASPEPIMGWETLSFIAVLPDHEIPFGQEVGIQATIVNADVDIHLQWQYLAPGQTEWQDVEGANDERLSFTYNEENCDYQWRLTLTALGEQVEE